MMEAAILRINGVVQGVGFRPFVYRLAHEFGLAGRVYNSSQGVVIEVEGQRSTILAFTERIPVAKPPLAEIRELSVEWVDPKGYVDFAIDHSQGAQETTVLVTPDVGTCADCTRELFSPADRRWGYPFINCTNCGPRFTIVKNLPYDRPFTTMAPFVMCPECQAEYDDPTNRRFHAQPNACPKCGPVIWLDHGPEPPEQLPSSAEVLREARSRLRAGQILAVKGLGGFHLVCDAYNEEAVAKLRQRKSRPAKPFAVMVPDLEVVRKLCLIEPEEVEELTSWRKPILLLTKNPAATNLAPSVAPGLDRLGVMLAYTPLHMLLFADGLECLVATSANFSDHPLVMDNREALEKLRPIVDTFLFHNREIFNRCDDSVLAMTAGTVRPIRRARGYAPGPIDSQLSAGHTLAFGGDEKNTFCLTKDRRYFLSQHIGEINNLESISYLEKGISRYEHYFQTRPELVVHDLHPEYRSTKTALKWAKSRDLPTLAVQHHQAHLAACLLEHNWTGPVLGLICDGTGYGSDGKLWGFELFKGQLPYFERIGRLAYTALPGGEVAIREPWRMTYSHLYTYLGLEAADRFAADCGLSGQGRVVSRQLELGLNSPPTSSAGRLFDAVSALLGITRRSTYEGQPAIELEVAAIHSPLAGNWETRLEFEIRPDQHGLLIDPTPLWADLWQRWQRKEDPGELAARFHHTMAAVMIEMLCRAAEAEGITTVALSGGVFQNRYLTAHLLDALGSQGFTVLFPRVLPVNDGGISAGQAILGHTVFKGGVLDVPGSAS